jgi:NitT/TauT family transport system substrate-binding protein
VTTDLVAGTQFLKDHPKRIKALLEGLYQANQYINQSPADAQSITNSAVAQITGKKLKEGVVASAWPHMAFTLDPLAASLKTAADHAVAVGLLKSDDLGGLYDLALLNQVLAAHGEPAVSGI